MQDNDTLNYCGHLLRLCAKDFTNVILLNGHMDSAMENYLHFFKWEDEGLEIVCEVVKVLFFSRG